MTIRLWHLVGVAVPYLLIATALLGLSAGVVKDAVRARSLPPRLRWRLGAWSARVPTVPLAYLGAFLAVAFIYGCAIDRNHMSWTIGADPHALADGADAYLYGLAAVSWLSALFLMVGYRWFRRQTYRLLKAPGELNRLAERYQILVDNLTDIVSHHDLSGQVTWASSATTSVLGVSPDDLVGTDPCEILHPDDAHRVREDLLAKRSWDTPAVFRAQVQRADGTYRWIETVVEAVRSREGGIMHFQATSRDVTERQQVEDDLHRRVHHDPLTGLANRVLFTLRLDALVEYERSRDAAAGEQDASFAVLYLDLDRFKAVNDTLGHAAGDELLVQVAQRLTASTREFDTVARIGGDEFAVLLEQCEVESAAIEAASRIERALREPFVLAGQVRSITVSIGIALGRPDHASSGDVLREADLAAYAAKAKGRASWSLFTPALREASDRRCRIESDLETAVANGELCVAYQPIVRLADGGLHGVEALVRWKHPELGLLAPESFIDIAEETGQISDLDHWVMAEALDQVGRWEARVGYPLSLDVAVNCSARDLDSPEFSWSVRALLAATELGNNRLVIEITESLLVDDPLRVAAVLQQLRDHNGVRFAMDDFGTGYSSLSVIHALPVDKVKADRAFVQRMHEDAGSLGMVQTVIGFAQSLGTRVVAEGIETPRQLAALREMGCEYGQGYLFAGPLAPKSMVEVIRDGGPWVRHWSELTAWS
ncbi:MAG: EAL domain-containing protein [Bacteroidota bacterium]